VRSIRSAELTAQPFSGLVRVGGMMLAVLGGQWMADKFYVYGEQKLEYNLVMLAVVVSVIFATTRISDNLVHRKIESSANET